ncbi:hypothetical protein QFZ37_002082 [Chryseobacterium ginsenosidimutans]|uniref:hypothetical protein n=1 Tax=Chryseobacterium ginsenosidimutans TaxID=687846 RepID=UPI0027834013|nr:hypothetical protein [Chryseobacterium ginsenosidimutans]MDQ0593703.1 hypothetical protein [Chryseobacterium ginsenosidimutans]MDQ0593713.1 hypothetical protein [Chryseobacterium ginsenosidimutans]
MLLIHRIISIKDVKSDGAFFLIQGGCSVGGKGIFQLRERFREEVGKRWKRSGFHGA